MANGSAKQVSISGQVLARTTFPLVTQFPQLHMESCLPSVHRLLTISPQIEQERFIFIICLNRVGQLVQQEFSARADSVWTASVVTTPVVAVPMMIVRLVPLQWAAAPMGCVRH
jgi:hypothetical protein